MALTTLKSRRPQVTPRVVLIRSNPVWNDPRALRIARTLSSRFDVLVLAWDRENSHRKHQRLEDRLLIKRLKLRAPYGSSRLVLLYPFFWLWVFVNLLLYRPQIVHACDLDTLVPSRLFRLLFRTKLVFDCFDRFAMAFIPARHSIIYRCVEGFEDLLAGSADALITVSNERLATFRHRPRRTQVVMNCPVDWSDTGQSQVRSIQRNEYDFLLVYAGGIAADRGLLLISEAIRNLNNSRLVLAGRVINDRLLRALLQNPRIRYAGEVSHSEALRLQALADAIPIIYDPSVPINLVANPNKLFESMMLGKPVITNVCKEIVAKCGCGLLVEYDASAIKRAIIRLMMSRSLARKMGARGRTTFAQKYNWERMGNKLEALYRQLLLD